MKTNLSTAAVRKGRAELYSLMGDLPPRGRKVSARLLDRTSQDGYVLERLVLDLNGIQKVPAVFVKPADAKRGQRLPTVLFNHSHGGRYQVGKGELFDPAPYMVSTPFALDLTRRGFAVLAIDHWGFGQRSGRSESEIFKEFLWRGRVMWGMMVYDSLKAMDYLQKRRDVDAERIGTMGMSMGSTMAWWLAALDVRVKATVDICCLTEYQDLIDSHGLDQHGIYYYVPSLMKHFTAAEINALIAPRAHLGLAGRLDALTPLAGLKRIDAHLRKVYKQAKAADAWRMSTYAVAHQETQAMREEEMAFLMEHL